MAGRAQEQAAVQRTILYLVTVLVVLSLVSYTMTYTVRFTEAGVLTTFGRAGENSIKKDPGLNFKWPYPIQSVTTYDTRVRFADVRLETQQTADNRQIIVQGFCVWRVEDPLKFFQSFSNAGTRADDHYHKAEETVQSNLRSALGAVSKFRLEELLAADESRGRLPDLEKTVLDSLSSGGSGDATARQSLASVGVRAIDVGVSRIELPSETTTKVFERMAANRDRLAKELESRGESDATAIRSRAEADARRIEEFAKSRAEEIRRQGDREAAEFFAQMNSNPELAIFLRNIELLRGALAKRTTVVLSTSQPGVGLIRPDALEGLKQGQIPQLNLPEYLDGAKPAKAEPAKGDGAKPAGGGR